jgi:hypothetical protein
MRAYSPNKLKAQRRLNKKALPIPGGAASPNLVDMGLKLLRIPQTINVIFLPHRPRKIKQFLRWQTISFRKIQRTSVPPLPTPLGVLALLLIYPSPVV